MNFGEVLTRAWEIIWKNKVLWIFGLLAGLSGSGGSSNFRYNLQSNNGNLPAPMQGMQRFFENIPAWAIVLLVLFVLALSIILLVVSTLGRTGLVRGAWLADGGETGFTFGRLFSESRRYFWRVLLLGILIFVISIALLLIVFIPSTLAAVLTMGLAMICLLPLICLLVPVFIALSVIFELAIIAIIGEDMGVMDALRRAWEIFRANLAQIIVIGLAIVIGTAVVNFIFGLPLLLIMAPLMGAVFSQAESFMRGGMLVSLILFILYLPILLAVQALVTSYVESAWTVAFRRLTGRTANQGTASVIEVPVQ